jgi:hypothetical protein
MLYLCNSIGLIFDMIGVLLLFKYGLPSKVLEGGYGGYITEQPDKDEEAKYKKYKTCSNVGLSFIVLGFLIQFTVSVIFCVKTW